MQTQQAFGAITALKRITRRAFQERFPLMPDGVSRKYDAMDLFLTDPAYAEALEPIEASRTTLKLQITAGLNRLAASGYVDLDLEDAAKFTGMLLHTRIPMAFRLTPQERDAILSLSILDTERPS